MKKIILVMTTVFAMLVFMAFTCYGQGIDACYQKNDGQLRILTHNKDCNKDCDKDRNKDCDKDCDKDRNKDGYTNKCKPSEIPISWNEKGPPGAPGKDGAPGAPGKDGKTIRSGTGDPMPGDGNVGDFYLNTTTNTLFGPKTSDPLDPWPLIGTIATCAGTVCYDDNTSLGKCTQSFVSFCATHNRTGKGLYTITFTFDPPFAQKPVCVFYVQPDPAYVIIQLVQTDADPSFISTYTFAPADGMAPVDSRFNFICTWP